MCGLAGLFDPQGRFDAAALGHTVRDMTDTLRHRGPDDHGVWRVRLVNAAPRTPDWTRG